MKFVTSIPTENMTERTTSAPAVTSFSDFVKYTTMTKLMNKISKVTKLLTKTFKYLVLDSTSKFSQIISFGSPNSSKNNGVYLIKSELPPQKL
jgi:hypothetical protein